MTTKAPSKASVEPQTDLGTKRRRQSDAQVGAQPSKRQNLKLDRRNRTPDLSEAIHSEEEQGKPFEGVLSAVQPQQTASRVSLSLQGTSSNVGKTAGKHTSQCSSVGKDEAVRTKPFQKHEGRKEMVTKYSASSKILSPEFGSVSNSLPTRQVTNKALYSDFAAQDVSALAISGEEQGKIMAIDTSTEQSAARAWPQCQRPCRNCQNTHVAIPGCPRSETCIRISISEGQALAPTAVQTRHQGFLVPNDPYELSVLGWLIWSTYEHRVALQGATVGVPSKTKRPRAYIGIDVGHGGSEVVERASRSIHTSKSAFEAWWQGKKNLNKVGGKRWLVITFPWEMGDINILDASFGAMGRLFSLPSSGPAHRTCAKASCDEGRPLRSNQTGCLGSGDDPEDPKASNRDGDLSSVHEKVDQLVVTVNEGNADIPDLTDGSDGQVKEPVLHATLPEAPFDSRNVDNVAR